jgi:hypothetical protein
MWAVLLLVLCFLGIEKMMTKQMEAVVYSEGFLTYVEERGLTIEEFAGITTDAEATIIPAGWSKEDKQRWQDDLFRKRSAQRIILQLIEGYKS